MSRVASVSQALHAVAFSVFAAAAAVQATVSGPRRSPATPTGTTTTARACPRKTSHTWVTLSATTSSATRVGPAGHGKSETRRGGHLRVRPHPHILTHGNNGAIPAEWHHWDGSNCSATWHKEPYGVELYRWAGGPLACLWGLVARSLGVVAEYRDVARSTPHCVFLRFCNLKL